MTESAIHRAELFARFSRRSLVAMLVVVVVLGATALSLMLAPPGAVGRASNLGWWLIPVVAAAVIAVTASVRSRRWNPDAREVQMVMEDELRRTNLHRASRLALIVVLAIQWPLAMVLSVIDWLPGERAAMIMAAATITSGLSMLIAFFLIFDRE